MWPGRETEAVVHAISRATGEARLVVVMVHGTFGHRSKWTQEASTLARTLQSDVTAIYRFAWSGHNRQSTRFKAGRDLHNALVELAREHPGASLHIVAHSHGGMVALYALRSGGELDSRLAEVQITTLGTPFLAMTKRRLPVSVYVAFAIVGVLASISFENACGLHDHRNPSF